MLRFFRINDPYRLVFIFIILILIRVVQGFFIAETSYYELKWLLLGEWLGQGFSLYSETYDYTGPLSAFVYSSLNFLFGRSSLSLHFISSFLVIVQAGVFNSLLLKNKVYNENSYLPALLFVILMTLVPDFMTLSPQLMSLTFVLLALRNVIRRIDNEVTDELFLSCGLYIGIASMFYLPAVVFFLVFLISLILFSTAVLRRLLLYLFGFLLVFMMIGMYFYLSDALGLFLDRAILKGLGLFSRVSLGFMDLLYVGAPFLVLFVLSILKKVGSSRLTNFQQKVEQVLVILFLGAVATFFLSNESVGYELAFVVPVVAYFWTYYFILLKRRLFILIMPSVLIFGGIVYSCISYQDLVGPVLVPESTDVQVSTLVLGEKLEAYQRSTVLSPFFNASISEEFTDAIDTYEGADQFYDLITKIKPAIIEDDMGLMPKLMNRFPFLAEDYQKSGDKRYRKVSN